MKRRWLPLMTITFLALVYFLCAAYMVDAAKPAKASCKVCHAEFSSVIPKDHPPVQGSDLQSCTTCHKPDLTGPAKKNAFSARLHIAHLPPKGQADCMTCHKWVPGKSFGLIGLKESWGAPTQADMDLMKDIFKSWATSTNTDSLHAKSGIMCLQCHGKELPKADDTVDNPRCLACHGPMDKLAKKTEPKDFKDRNPHKSHLGDIACTVCHKAHAESKVYCLGCHQKFDMKIKGAGTAKP
ncbi:MAG: hypothetical protein CSYNP_02392 [Syntrophus sp. SKADARSKE-3]|nr:hypothetical protein [Syntrophus sp. SKADARSKE-3]